MVNCSCHCELGKSRKQRHREEEDITNTTDRFSHLPGPILYHILSFLDTKSAVQTSVLSRVWNRVWKHVPALDLHRRSFRQAPSFERFVSKVLSLRYNLNLHRISYVDDVGPCDEEHESRLVKVINYALSHGVEQLVVHKNNDLQRSSYRFFRLFMTVFSSTYTNNDLRTLELRCITLDRGVVLCTGFPMLTALNVTSCLLDTTSPVLFSNFPCLKHLTVSNWLLPDPRSVRRIKLYGPQLLSLELVGMDQFKIEIFAPKLEFFSLCQDSRSQGFFELALPALDHADVVLTWMHLDLNKKQVDRYLNSLFQGLRNARSLRLDRSTIQVLKKSEFLGQNIIPFNRLEALIVPPSYDLPDKLISYFSEASPNILVEVGR